MIMWRHILPNSITPVVTLVPFEMAAAIGALTSLDFHNPGVPPGTPSLGELLSQGKDNLYAWWISVSTFTVLVVMLLLLILIGDALRDALDPRKVLETDAEEAKPAGTPPASELAARGAIQ
jgi:microcin C transport system permease protein